jgi:protein-tyrosine phosphatase
MPSVQEIFQSYKNNADLIIPRVWLGNFNASQDLMFLKANQITVIVNCTKDLPFLTAAGAKQYRIPIHDNLDPVEIRNLSLWSYEAVQKIMAEYKAGHHILIHCAAGMQRSAAVVAMFLIAFYRTHFIDAAVHIKKRRPIAFFPSANFKHAIHEFDESFHQTIMPKLGQLPGTIPEEF